MTFTRNRTTALLVLSALWGAAWANATAADESRSGSAPLPAVEGMPVFPPEVRLRGRDARQQLLVTGLGEDGRQRDLTRRATWESRDSQVATVSATGVVEPAGSGRTEIVVTAGDQRAVVAVEIERGDEYLPIDFKNEILPILTKRGCNGGGCHGKSDGRGGFALSLFGFRPEWDHEQITREGRNRRLFPAAPANSLLLQKPTTAVSHGGGRRLTTGEPEYERLVRWIATGTPWRLDDAPELVGLEVEPEFRAVGPDRRQQLVATAVYSDGSRRDVTRLAEFRTNDPSIAEVDEFGLVTTAHRTGETAIVVLLQGRTAVSRIMVPLSAPASDWPELPVANFVDEHVQRKLRAINVPPSPLTDDATFLRRASLQIAGRLPTPDEVEEFLSDGDSGKRTAAVRRLLDSGDYADHFAQKWSDILRNKRRGQADRLPGTIAFHRWIRNALATNIPYDRFVREILTATGNVGVNPPAQWYAEVRYLDRYVDDTAQVFLGTRIGCARCHHHPFESVSQEDYYGLAAFFARVDRKGGSGVAERRANETVLVKPTGEVKHPLTGKVVPPQGLGGEPLDIPPYDDPRGRLADWMAAPENPFFARAFVNRMWGHFFGRGLVDPIDDLRETNPATNAPLLDALADEFIRSGFDMKHVVELICTSTTYQLSSDANADNLDETQNHSRFYVQRLKAEVLLDAIDAVTDNGTRFGGLPAGTRAVQLPDENYSNQFLKLFGRPLRESACECERATEPSLSQSLFAMTDSFLLGKVSGGRFANRLVQEKRSDDEKIRELFLTALSREPTPRERAAALEYVQGESDPKAAWSNLLWAMLNTKEFQYVH